MKICLISLGCPKNLVDSEEMLGVLAGAGHQIQADPEDADIVIVNTCGFIESAKEESVEAVLNAVHLKETGRCRKVMVAGCLSQRYSSDLAREIPEADAFLGVGEVVNIPEIVEKVAAGEKHVVNQMPPQQWIESRGRVRSTPSWTAYLKVSDGCNNRCSYCAIPDIRGMFRSRPASFVLDEAKRLADEGVKEINLVGQDLTFYGSDLGDGWSLERLLREMAGIDGIRWIRLLYCYPTRISDELIELVAGEPKIAKYMDIPFQHGDDSVLRVMNRRGTRDYYLDLVRKIRSAGPEIALRSSFIVGFPGETKEAFENLLSFVEEIRFDRVGAFMYSCEEGTPAERLTKRVAVGTAKRRWEQLMELQQGISLERNRELIGKELDVLVESVDETGTSIGRSYRDAPEIDGVVKITGAGFELGAFTRVRIAKADTYDLSAEAVV